VTKQEWHEFERFCFGFFSDVGHWTMERDTKELLSNAEMFLKEVKRINLIARPRTEVEEGT